MRFAIPVNAPFELLPLKESGADEFYCGFQDESWSRTYGTHDSLTRRQDGANFTDWGLFSETLRESDRLGLPLSLTLNGRYTSGQLPEILRLAERYEDAGGKRVILRSPTLASFLRDTSLSVTVSLLASCLNASAARYWVSLGADRIVLPRELSPDDMKTIARCVPDCEYEAMIFDDNCRFSDGCCRCIHGASLPARQDDVPAEREIFSYDLSGCAHHLCLDGSHSSHGCGACALEELSQAGVAVGKLGGRGTPLSHRLEALAFFRKAAALPPEERPSLHEKLFGVCRCYYAREGDRYGKMCLSAKA